MGILDFLKADTPEDRFAKLAMASMRKAGWTQALTYDQDKFLIQSGDASFFLDNVYADWRQADKADKAALMDHMGQMPFQMTGDRPATLEEASPQILPVIRNLGHVMNLWMNPDVPLERDVYLGAHRVLCGTLAVFVALDSPVGISLVDRKDLEKWSVSFDDLIAIGMDNLRARSTCQFVKAKEGFFISDFGDYHDASRILLPDLFAMLPLRGAPVAIVTSRSGLLVAGSEDANAVRAMGEFADEVMKTETRPISQAAVILQDGQWRKFDGGTEQSTLARLQLQQDLWDHAEQAEALQAYFGRIDRDVFVATLGGHEIEGRYMSWATWAHDAESLLPMADVFFMSHPDGSSLARQRTDVEALCNLELEEGHYPPRYHVRTGADKATWAKLKARPAAPGLPDNPSEASQLGN